MANDQLSKETQMIMVMLKDLKQDFKDHADSVYVRLNSLQCSAQNVRLENVEDKVEILEAAPAKKNASLVAWCGVVMSGVLGLFEFLKSWRN